MLTIYCSLGKKMLLNNLVGFDRGAMADLWTSKWQWFRWNWRRLGAPGRWATPAGPRRRSPRWFWLRRALQRRRCSLSLGSTLLSVAGSGATRSERLGCLKVLHIVAMLLSFYHWAYVVLCCVLLIFIVSCCKCFVFGWLGEKLLQLEREKGIVIRFMIGHRFFSLTNFVLHQCCLLAWTSTCVIGNYRDWA